MPLLYPPSRLLCSFFPLSLTLNTDQQRACASHMTPTYSGRSKGEREK